MEDVICIHIAPLCPRLWRDLACVNGAISRRLVRAQAQLTTHKVTTNYTRCTITHNVTEHGIKHGPFTLTTNKNKQIATGNYRLGLLHGELLITPANGINRVINYYNGRLHGDFKIINGRYIRHCQYKHGVLHGDMIWELDFYNMGMRKHTARYVDGIVDGREECNVIVDGEIYPYFLRTYTMGKMHGRCLTYHIDIGNNNAIKSTIAFDVEYEYGKVKHIYVTSGGPITYKWIHKYNKTYLECWNNGKLQNSGDVSYGGYSAEVIITNDALVSPQKSIHESRYRNQNGSYINLNDDNTISKLFTVKQYVVDGSEILFNSSGIAICSRTIQHGYIHGVCKYYRYDDRIVAGILTHNYLYDYYAGERVKPQLPINR
ncbi:histone H3 K4-specific methyltransferase SET7/9 [Faustovirus]|nr:histone H3 K4-specific methyltransferase SET7/9 [Faustovirus]QJX73616.1 histone H3 K4-specific methyltransferase SET7/9 [Faustovirus]